MRDGTLKLYSYSVEEKKVLQDALHTIYDQTLRLSPCEIDSVNKPELHTHALRFVRLISILPLLQQKADSVYQDTEWLSERCKAFRLSHRSFECAFMSERERRLYQADVQEIETGFNGLDERVCELDVTLNPSVSLIWEEYDACRNQWLPIIEGIDNAPRSEGPLLLTTAIAAKGLCIAKRIEKLLVISEDLRVPTIDVLKESIIQHANAIRRQSTLKLLHEIRAICLAPCIGAEDGVSYQCDLTIADLVGANYDTARLLAGPSYANRLSDVAQTVYNRTLEKVPCTLDTIGRPPDHGMLVSMLMLYQDADKLRQRCVQLSRDIEVTYGAHVVFLDGFLNYARNIVMTRKKADESSQTLDLLEQEVSELESSIASLLEEIEAYGRPSNGEMWLTYESNRTLFDGIISTLTGSPKSNGKLVSTSDLASARDELVARLMRVSQTFAILKPAPIMDERKRLGEKVKELREQIALERLASIDVDVLSNGDIRVGPLKSAGFTTMRDIWGMDAKRLSLYHGITLETGDVIEYAVDSIFRSAYETSRVRIDAEKRPPQQTDLIVELRKSMLLDKMRPLVGDVERHLNEARLRTGMIREASDYIDNLTMTLERRGRFALQLDFLRRLLASLETEIDTISKRAIEINAVTASDAWRDFKLNAASYYAKLEDLGGLGQELMTGYLPKRLVDKVARFDLDTTDMKATLRGYQRFGAQYALLQEKTLIGDEMGLGKTVEAIAALAHLHAKREIQFMVVCPLSVLINWVREIPNHSKLRTVAIHGNGRNDAFRRWCLHGGVAVTTYETVSRLPWHLLEDERIAMAVIDEAHYVKNPRAKRSEALVKEVLDRSDRVLFLTGTPLENSVAEMNVLLSYLDQDLVEYELGEDVCINPIEYRKAIAPVYLRRRRQDVLDELPQKVEEQEWCSLTKEDLADYRDALRKGSFSAMRRVGWRHGDIKKSSKAIRLMEIVEEAKENGSKVLVFSYFLDTLSKVAGLVGSDCQGIISGKVAPKRRQQIIDDFTRSDKTVLVLQVSAGGVGLNIQAANVVVFCEPQLKPSMEDQAISRSYRMGQVRTVLVYRLLMVKTVDERVEEILSRKRQEFAAYANESDIGKESLGVVDTTAIREIIEAERMRYGVLGGESINTNSFASDGEV